MAFFLLTHIHLRTHPRVLLFKDGGDKYKKFLDSNRCHFIQFLQDPVEAKQLLQNPV